MKSIERRNIKSVRQQVSWLNSQNTERFVKALSPSFVWKSDVLPPNEPGPEGGRQGLNHIFETFPDLQFRELELYATGTVVVGIYDVRGTQIQGTPGSPLPQVKGRPWQVNQAAFHTFDRHGMMTSIWLFTNVAHVLQQVGFYPTTSRLPDLPPSVPESPQGGNISLPAYPYPERSSPSFGAPASPGFQSVLSPVSYLFKRPLRAACEGLKSLGLPSRRI